MLGLCIIIYWYILQPSILAQKELSLKKKACLGVLHEDRWLGKVASINDSTRITQCYFIHKIHVNAESFKKAPRSAENNKPEQYCPAL